MASANRISGMSMLKAVLSNSGVERGRSSSAHNGPRREADCVVAKMGIERVVPVLGTGSGEGESSEGGAEQGGKRTSSYCFLCGGDTVEGRGGGFSRCFLYRVQIRE